jgi:lipopolysaccharide transport system permease protein
VSTITPPPSESSTPSASPEPQVSVVLAPTNQKPHLTIRAKHGPINIDLPELWRFRDLLFQLALRDLRLRYKQTALGVIWVVLQPLLAAGIFTFVFGVLAKLPTDGKPAFLISFVGLLAWNLFAGTLGKISGSFVGNAHLLSKVYFPRLILPLSSIPSVLVDFSVALGMGVVLMLIYRVVPHWGILLLPVWMFALIALATGVGLITASLSVSYRDINYILPVATQMLLYLSPVGYALVAVPQHLQIFYVLNPLAGVIEAFRWSLLGGTFPNPIALVVTVGSSVALLLLGLWTFRQTERKFADVV